MEGLPKPRQCSIRMHTQHALREPCQRRRPHCIRDRMQSRAELIEPANVAEHPRAKRYPPHGIKTLREIFGLQLGDIDIAWALRFAGLAGKTQVERLERLRVVP